MDRLVEAGDGSSRGGEWCRDKWHRRGQERHREAEQQTDQNPRSGRMTLMMMSVMAWHTIAAISPFRQ